MPKRTTPAVRSVNTATPARRRPNTLSPTAPKLPHEHDQSVSMTDGAPSKTVQQAYRDVAKASKTPTAANRPTVATKN